MITFVGLGLWDETDITLKGLEAVRKADKVYAEFYTSMMGVELESLEKLYGRKVELLSREDLEERSVELLKEAKQKNIVILVAGDPFVATTHNSVLIDAKKMGVPFRIIHNASIVSAISGVTGLHIYKFGKTATVSHPYKGIISRKPIDTIRQNLSINAHTLLLLDLNPPMEIGKAVEILEKVDDGTLNHFAVGVARVGGDCQIKCDYFYELKSHDFGSPPHSIVFLSKTLHITEFEFLKEFADPPKEIEEIVE